MINTPIASALACPYCGGKLVLTDTALCKDCSAQYQKHGAMGYNFHLQQPKKQCQTKVLGEYPLPEDSFFAPLESKQNPEIDVANLPKTKHLFPALNSYIPKPRVENPIALDIGCGKAQNRKLLESIGYNYIGLDYREEEATVLGDAHALPLTSNSIDFALSMAVLEHLPHPDIMVEECFRVLKAGSVFLGSVAFMQPFHDNSYHHLSHLGTYSLLKNAGFEIVAIAPSREYSVLIAHGRQLFRQMNRRTVGWLMSPMIMLHKLWWKRHPINPTNPKLSEIRRLQKFSGAIHFVAYKPI